MALTRCPECRAKISDQAAVCVKCGAPVAGKPKKKKSRGCGLIFPVLLIGGIMLAVHYRDALLSSLRKVDKEPADPSPVTVQAEDLSAVTMDVWSGAAYGSRLQTAEAFVLRFLKEERASALSGPERRRLSAELERRMSEANQNRLVDDKTVETVAETCWLLMRNP